MSQYTCMLFDVDGTLLDTKNLILASFRAMLHEYGGDHITDETVISHMGIPLDRQIELFLGITEPQKVAEIRAFYVDFQKEIYKDYIRPFEGVRESLEKLKEHGIVLGIVTSRLLPSLVSYLEFTGLSDFFSVIITPEITEKHKPHPEPVLTAMEKLKALPEKTAFVGDAVFDMQAGQSAGVATVFAGWGPNLVDDLPFRPTHAFNHFSEITSLLN